MSDSFDGERVAAGSSSAETVAASLETFAEERPDAAAGVATVAPFATFDAVGETRAPPPFAWAPWRRGGDAARTGGAAARTDEPLREEDAASSTRAAASSDAPDSSAPHSGVPDRVRAPLTAAERRGGRGVVEDWVPGMPVVVQVTRLGSGHKGPRVTARPTLPGRNVVLCPDGEGVYVSRKLAGAARAYVKSVGAEVAPPDCALIMRTEAAGVSKEVLATDITSLAADWRGTAAAPEAAVAACPASTAARRCRAGCWTRPPRSRSSCRTCSASASRAWWWTRSVRATPSWRTCAGRAPPRRRSPRWSCSSQTGSNRFRRRRPATFRRGRRPGFSARRAKELEEREVWDALGLRDAIVSAESERVWLSARDLPGAHLVIQRTEALTAVDVNAGRAAFSAEGNTEGVAFAVNVAAAAEMAARLRLRDVGGWSWSTSSTWRAQAQARGRGGVPGGGKARPRAGHVPAHLAPRRDGGGARRLQGNHAGRHVVADEKGMPVDPGRPSGGPRRVRGPAAAALGARSRRERLGGGVGPDRRRPA